MPAPLVTLALAKLQLRITDTDHDEDVELRRQQATDAIAEYLEAAFDAAWTVDTVPSDVQQAILVLVSHFYERGQVTTPERGGTPSDADVWLAIWRLLRRRRTDAIA